VLLDRLATAINELPAEDVIGDASARLTSKLGGDHQRARAELGSALTSPRYAALLESLAEWSVSPPFTAADGARVSEAVQFVSREFKRTQRKARAVGAAPDEDHDVAWHDLRKATKRLRYAAEAVVPVSGADAARFVSATEHVQEVLGERQDAVTALALLRAEGRAAHRRKGGNGYTYGILAAAESDRIAQAEDAFADAWRRLSRKKSRRWLQRVR
jgi:CHAD domain-containing protein